MAKSTKVRSHGNNVRDVIIAHVISADAQIHVQIYRRGNGKVILGPAGHALCTRPAGKKEKVCLRKCFYLKYTVTLCPLEGMYNIWSWDTPRLLPHMVHIPTPQRWLVSLSCNRFLVQVRRLRKLASIMAAPLMRHLNFIRG